jgi:hypothetical protein
MLVNLLAFLRLAAAVTSSTPFIILHEKEEVLFLLFKSIIDQK